jgi:phosphatidylserine/phosphatidylglycerophosphate/cardiolipin synthase-like enzyme
MGLFSKEPELLADFTNYARASEIFEKAQRYLTIVSPFIKPGDALVRQIEQAANVRKVSTTVIFREDKESEYSKAPWFERLGAAHVRLGVIDRLHSKIYRSEQAALVTSMNFYASSADNSFELGVFFESDHKLATPLDHYLKMLETSARWLGQGVPRSNHQAEAPRAQSSQGHCIRCGTEIAFDHIRPYCPHDYESWKKWKDPDYEDKFCHRCGTNHPATMNKPLCRDCFKQVA